MEVGADVDQQVVRWVDLPEAHCSTRRNAVVAPDNRMECCSDDRNPDNYWAGTDLRRVDHPAAFAYHSNHRVEADRPEGKEPYYAGVRVGRPCCCTSCVVVDPWVGARGAGNFPAVLHREVHPEVLHRPAVGQLARVAEAVVQQRPFSTVRLSLLVEVDFHSEVWVALAAA